MTSARSGRHRKLSDLPVELWLQIANHLRPRDAVVLATTNRQFYHFLIDQAYHRSIHEDNISISALMWAITHGLLTTAERALAQGQDPNQHIDERYFSIGGNGLPLIEALDYPSVEDPNLKMVELLLRYGANPYATCFQGNPITISALRGNRACLEVLLSVEKDGGHLPRLATFRDHDGDTVLHIAAESDRPGILEFLTERGVKIDARDTYGRTALCRAVSAGCSKNVAWLLRAGADPFIVGHDAWDLVELAVAQLTPEDVDGPRCDIFRQVTEVVFDDNSPQAWYHMTESQLHRVMLRTHSAQGLEVLCALGANMDAKSDKGLTVLWEVCGYMYGAEEGAVDLAQALIDGKADINFKSPEDGSTPLMQAIKSHSSEIVPLLLERGKSLNLGTTDHEGKTAWDWAIELHRVAYAVEIQDLMNLNAVVDLQAMP